MTSHQATNLNLNFLLTNQLSRRTAEVAGAEIISSWEQESIIRAQAAINRLYRRVHDNPELSEWQVEVLDKATQYGIKYNFDNIDWFKLSDHIEELEPLIEEAESYGIYEWDANDLVDIRQRIEEAQCVSVRERSSSYRDYLSSRL